MMAAGSGGDHYGMPIRAAHCFVSALFTCLHLSALLEIIRKRDRTSVSPSQRGVLSVRRTVLQVPSTIDDIQLPS